MDLDLLKNCIEAGGLNAKQITNYSNTGLDFLRASGKGAAFCFIRCDISCDSGCNVNCTSSCTQACTAPAAAQA